MIEKLPTNSGVDWSVFDPIVARLKAEYQVEGELIDLNQLAKILGVPVQNLWNYRFKGKMPKIPVLDLGGRDMFWLPHVAKWLYDSGSMMNEEAAVMNSTKFPAPVVYVDDAPVKKGKAKDAQPKKQMSVYKQAILRDAMVLMAQAKSGKT